ncbi:DNA mismatch repair endonuclease MutL [candidate division WWE3 bacterium]|nr:DNA mismatch repair endonuclease MutL [candidate division WWE3 bacterium]
MPRIHQLPEQLVNQIAAGEVVDRPSSVVKELVENSLDAGASRIEIYIEKGGKKLIRIVDNGNGMEREDLEGSVKRHWTSKINNLEDLHNIQSFGFRGEALASIASVSKFEIRSRQSNSDEGWSLTMGENGAPIIKPIGMPSGTEIIVAELFYNVPARLNFLKQDATEGSHIQELVYQLALINPNVMFVLHKDGRAVFRSPGGNEIRPLLNAVLGESLAGQMVAIHNENPHVEVSGWVGKPGTGSASRARQYAFVNGRIVDNRIIWSAVAEGYGSVLGRHEKPQFVIRIDMAPHLVDVNVHPQKKEIKFSSPQLVFQLIRQAIINAFSQLREQLPEPTITPQSTSEDAQAPTPVPKTFFPPVPYPSYSANSKVREVADPTQPTSKPIFSPSMISASQSVPEQSFELTKPLRVFQLLDLFIFEEKEDGIVVYDQHAVHERVLYEKFTNQYLSEKQNRLIQPLLVPTLIEVSPLELSLWEQSRDLLFELGFETELMGEGTIRINSVPSVLAGNMIGVLLKEFLQDLSDSDDVGESTVKGIDMQTHRRLAYLSCRSAIKAGDRLKPEEIQRLIRDFHGTTINFTCPHGRPVRIEFSRREMEKWFKR